MSSFSNKSKSRSNERSQHSKSRQGLPNKVAFANETAAYQENINQSNMDITSLNDSLGYALASKKIIKSPNKPVSPAKMKFNEINNFFKVKTDNDVKK